jgi:hypothetical protein
MAKIKKFEFEGGHVVYRIPNVIERMKMIGVLGISTQEDKRLEYDKQSEFMLQAKLMECIPEFKLIQDIKLQVKDRTITSWAEAIEEDSFFVPLNLVTVEIMKTITGDLTTEVVPGNEEAPKQSQS